MANLLGTTVNGALSASGRISVTYDTDRYQFNFLRASGSNWWVTNDTGNLGLHLNNVGDKFYFSTGGDFYSDTNGWLSTALGGKLSLSGGTMSGDIIFPDNSSAGLRNAAANAGFRLDDQYGNMYSYNFGGGYYVDATSYYFRSSTSSNWMTISGGTVEASGDFRAPIFYDSANTGYYLDPNSTSNIVTLYASTLYGSDVYTNGGWFRNHSNNNGIYWNNTGWHLMPENTADFRIHSGNNSESALRIETNGTTRGYVYANSSNEIGFLNNGRSWRLRVYSGGAVESYGDFRAPIFYDSQDTTYYFDGNSTTSLRTKGSWRADSADWDGEYSGKIQYHANHWYFQAGNFWFFRNAGGANVVSINQGGNISVSGYVGDNSGQTRDKLRVWDGSAYTIGMKSGYNYGHLGTDQYAMSFQMNNENGRGFWWGDNAHSDNEGAASLTTDGRMVIAKSLSIGEGESILSPSSTPLYVKGTTSGADVVGVDGINGRLFTVTDDLSGSLFSVNTIAGLPVIEAFADNTVTIGKYGYATTWSTTGFMTVPNSANIYRDLFINGGRSGNFGNRLIIGTDAATYTLNDGNQRPVAYLHGQYPVLTLNHTVTSNTAHGPTIQFTHHTNDKQWVIGSNGTGTRLDIGYSTNTDRNPHNGIDDYNGSTFIRVDNGGNVQLGRGNGRSTWVNDTLYVGASDSGDSHMYFGEDSSGWYGLHWYWDSGFTVYLYGRNAGTDTEIMRYTTNSNAYVEWRRHFNMNNYEINYVSQLHFNNNTRFVNSTANYLYFQLGSDSYGSIQVRDNSNNLKGYLGYFDSNGFGLLNSAGSWGIRLDPGNAGADIYYAGAVKLRTLSNGARVYGDLYLDDNYGNTIVGAYDSYRYQGIFAMGNAYKLAADGQGTGNLYGLAWTHTNVGGQSKPGLEHQLLVMNYGTTLTAIGNGIWTAGTITTVNHGNSSQWNTAYGWGNHAGLYVRAYGTTADNIDADWGQSFKTFDPVPSGTPPIASPNLRTINVGESFSRRTQLAFTYATDQAWFRRRDDGGWQAWREFIHSGNIGSQSVSYATSAGSASSATTASGVTVNSGNTSAAWYPIVWHSGNTLYSSSGVEIYAAGNYIRSQYINTTDNDETTITRFVIKNGDNYHRSATNASAAVAIRDSASGTWGINITGDAGSVDGVDSSAIVYGGNGRASNYVGSMDDPNQKSGFYFKDGPTGQPFGDWWNWLTVAGNSWQSSNNYSFQIIHAFHSDDAYIRRMTNGTPYSWRTLITSGNIGSQSVNYATSAGSATSSTSASYASGLSRYGIIYGNDWNSYNVNGQFIVMSAHGHSGTNRPSGAYNYGSGMSYYNSGSDHYQFYFPENSGSSNGNSHKIWYRSGWNNSWGGWRSIVDIYNSVCYIDGAITATGDITAFSDARVKENVETLEGALDKTLKLRGVSYTRTDVEDKSKKIGVIAQEILEVVPEVVSQDENGMYAVSYGNITALLIEAIKEQQKQIDELKEIINGLTR